MTALPRPMWVSVCLWGGLYGAVFGLLMLPWVLSLLINGFWGIGVGLIAPFLMPKSTQRPVLW